jgi:hypothetical protein
MIRLDVEGGLRAFSTTSGVNIPGVEPRLQHPFNVDSSSFQPAIFYRLAISGPSELLAADPNQDGKMTMEPYQYMWAPQTSITKAPMISPRNDLDTTEHRLRDCSSSAARVLEFSWPLPDMERCIWISSFEVLLRPARQYAWTGTTDGQCLHLTIMRDFLGCHYL